VFVIVPLSKIVVVKDLVVRILEQAALCALNVLLLKVQISDS
jgi:hypothetical protein